jgi:hypothetical protein
MKDTRNGCHDILKVLPTLLMWERVWEEVNEVSRF